VLVLSALAIDAGLLKLVQARVLPSPETIEPFAS